MIGRWFWGKPMLRPRWNWICRHPDMKQLTQNPTLGLSGLTECLKCKSDKGRRCIYGIQLGSYHKWQPAAWESRLNFSSINSGSPAEKRQSWLEWNKQCESAKVASQVSYGFWNDIPKFHQVSHSHEKTAACNSKSFGTLVAARADFVPANLGELVSWCHWRYSKTVNGASLDKSMLPHKQVSKCHKTVQYTKDPLTFLLGNQSCPKSFVSPSLKWTSGYCPKALTSSPISLV